MVRTVATGKNFRIDVFIRLETASAAATVQFYKTEMGVSRALQGFFVLERLLGI
jgi:hypothetical protein